MSQTLQPQLFPLLRQLDDGKFHSGERLARAFGVSRASVFNALSQAETLGVRIQAVRGRGYRLPQPIDWLNAAIVAENLGPLAGHFRFDFRDTLDSTNACLFDIADTRTGEGWVCSAEYQHSGKGRRGRAWQSALGGGLAFSVLYRFESGLAGLSGLSLAVGLAVARAINRHSPHPVGLKWPNDLVVGPRKLGGILVEVQGDMDGPALAVIGVGLNLHLPEALREGIDQAVVDLSELGATVGRNALLAECLSELHAVMTSFRARGFAALRESWMALDAYRNLPVTLSCADGSKIRGVASGVDADGALLLADAAGVCMAYRGGELSMRLARP